MRIIGIVLVVAAYVLFQRAPAGLHWSTVGSFALFPVAIAFFFAGGSRALARELASLAAELGFSDAGSWYFGPTPRVVFRGEREGRAVDLRVTKEVIRGSRRGRLGRTITIYHVEGSVSCRNPGGRRLAILPALGPFNVYLEFLPPRIEHTLLGEIGYRVYYGAPREEAVSLPQRLDRNSYAGLRGDSAKIRLKRGRCSFETSSTNVLPSGDRLKALLSLCARISELADA